MHLIVWDSSVNVSVIDITVDLYNLFLLDLELDSVTPYRIHVFNCRFHCLSPTSLMRSSPQVSENRPPI